MNLLLLLQMFPPILLFELLTTDECLVNFFERLHIVLVAFSQLLSASP